MNVGDYVRTKNGINKIIYIDDIFGSDGKHSFYTIKLDNDNLIFDDEVIKPSPNIIDLIEAEDYVNGYKVLNVLDFNDNSKMLSLEKIYDSKITNEDIKSIVTKEQFESMKYKVGD